MLLLALPLAGLAAGLLRGGSLFHLATVPLRGVAWILGALALQLVMYAPGIAGSSMLARWGPSLYMATLGITLVGVAMNWRLGWGLWVIGLGLALNTLVIAANGGHMPTDLAAQRRVAGVERVRAVEDTNMYGNARPADRASKLLPLSDVLPVPLPPGHGNVYSIGDVILGLGAAAAVYGATRHRKAPAPRRYLPASGSLSS